MSEIRKGEVTNNRDLMSGRESNTERRMWNFKEGVTIVGQGNNSNSGFAHQAKGR